MSIALGMLPKLTVEIKVYDACPDHPNADCTCPRTLLQSGGGEDTSLIGFWQFVQLNCLNSNVSGQVTDTGGTARTISANTAITGVNIVAGTAGSPAAAFAQTKLYAQASSSQGSVTGNVGALGTPSASQFTITGTITNSTGSAIIYNEVGIQATTASYTFQFARDAPLTAQGGPFTVPASGGQLVITYTGSGS